MTIDPNIASQDIRMLTYNIEDRGERPLYEFIYDSIKTDILAGRLAEGEKLPSKRKLASNLSVSLITIEGAFKQLVAEGYIYSSERRGFYVNRILPQSMASDRNLEGGSDRSVSSHHADDESLGSCDRREQESASCARMDDEEASIAFDLTGKRPPKGLFPYNRWAACIRKSLADADEERLLEESGPFGSFVLRKAIANFLFAYRGVEVDPRNIVVAAGSQMLYQLIIQLLGHDRIYALEDPGYRRLARIYAANAVETRFIATTDDGIDVRRLRETSASVAHIMPSHQYPTGCITPIARRYELLSWATSSPGKYIIEDDYDSELRFSGRPIPSLQSIDAQSKVIYLNTFAKSLGPSFRISYMVLPEDLTREFQKRLGFYSCTVNAVDQLALARFINDGDLERHINRLRTHFRSIAERIQNGLKRNGLETMSLCNASAGSHGLLRIKDRDDAHAFAEVARTERIRIKPLADFRLDEADRSNRSLPENAGALLFFEFGSLKDGDVDPCCERLARAYGAYAR